MIKKFIRFFTSLLLITVIASSSLSASYANTTVTVTNLGFNQDTDVVPSNLGWTKKSISLAREAQANLYREIKDQLNYLRSQGAVRVVRIKHKLGLETIYSKQLGISDYLYSLEGYAADGNLVDSTDTLFYNYQGPSSRTVYLTQDTCLFRPFNLFDYATWFMQQCGITVESKEKFLRAALQNWIVMVGGYSPGVPIAEELKTITSQKLSFKVEYNIFKCLGCTDFIWTPYTSFPMEHSDGLWPYKITYEPKSGHLAMKIMKPNYKDLINNVSLVSPATLLFTTPESKLQSFTLLR
jgi:hypothetical protein